MTRTFVDRASETSRRRELTAVYKRAIQEPVRERPRTWN